MRRVASRFLPVRHVEGIAPLALALAAPVRLVATAGAPAMLYGAAASRAADASLRSGQRRVPCHLAFPAARRARGRALPPCAPMPGGSGRRACGRRRPGRDLRCSAGSARADPWQRRPPACATPASSSRTAASPAQPVQMSTLPHLPRFLRDQLCRQWWGASPPDVPRP